MKEQNLTDIIIDAIQEKKGEKITIIDLSDIQGSSVPEFVICQGKNPSQTYAIAENIKDRVREKLSLHEVTSEGYRNLQWIILDYGSLMVHVFLPETREFYNLEDLWIDGKITQIPDFD